MIEVVSRGGNLALNVGPQPDGRLPAEALKSLSGLGTWLRVNGNAIYGTRALDVAQIENVMYTQKGDTVFAIIPLDEGEVLGKTLFIPTVRKVESVKCLGYDGALRYQSKQGGITVELPADAVGASPYAIAFEMIH